MTGQQLRNSILQEAIQGRLVPNKLQPGEKTGADLLQDILAERQKKENQEKGKKAKKLSLSIIEEEPWELPEGWCWCQISDFCEVKGGKRIPAGRKLSDEDTGYKYIRVSDMKNGSIKTNELKYVPIDIVESIKRYTISKDDLYITVAGTIGDVGIVPEELDGANLTENADKLVFSIVDKKWLFWFLTTPFIKQQIRDVTTKVGQPKLAINKIEELYIPLPPLSIQKAIVEKIEELFPIVDEYDKAAGELKALIEALPDKLRKSVLQEAIHGNLVPNEIPEGEATAQELLQQILKERQDRENATKGKKAKKLTLSEIDDDVVDLPDGWSWCKLSDLGDCLYGVSESAKTVGDYKLLRITDIQNDSVNWNTVPMSDYKKKDVDNYLLKPGDLVFARTGGTVGKSYLIEAAPNNAIYASYLIRVRFQGGALLPKYIKYFFQSPQYWSQVIESSEGTGQPNCNGTKLANLNIPLPPLSIQKAIVAKIEEVFAAIDKLK